MRVTVAEVPELTVTVKLPVDHDCTSRVAALDGMIFARNTKRMKEKYFIEMEMSPTMVVYFR